MIAMEKNKIQSIIFAVSSIVCYILSNRFVYMHGLLGAAISYFSVMLLILVLYYFSFNYYLKKEVVS